MESNPFFGFLTRLGFTLEGDRLVKLGLSHSYYLWEDPLNYWISCYAWIQCQPSRLLTKAFQPKGHYIVDDLKRKELRSMGMKFASEDTI